MDEQNDESSVFDTERNRQWLARLLKEYTAAKPLRTYILMLGLGPFEFLRNLLVFILKSMPIYSGPLVLATAVEFAEADVFDSFKFWLYAGGYILLLLSNVPLHTLYVHYASQITRNIERGLRLVLVRRLQRLSISFHTESESGRLQAKILRDVDEIMRLTEMISHHLLGTLGAISFALAIAFSRDWRMGIAFLFLAPVCIVFVRFFRGKIRKRNRDYRVEMETMSQRISEMVDMTVVTRAHGVEEREVRTMRERLDDVYLRGKSLDLLNGFFGASSTILLQLFLIGLLIVTVLMVHAGVASVSSVVLYYTSFSMIISSANVLINSTPVITRGFESIRSLGELMESPDLEHNQGKSEVANVAGDIHLDSIEFSYPETEKPVLSEIDLSISRGETVALVGESGSGKSTLIQLAIGFLRPQAGTIYLDGKDMETLDMRTYRRHIAVVPQNVILFSGSIRDNITYGMFSFTEADIEQALRDANLYDFVQTLPEGLDTRIGESGFKLSGGQRQRLAIARAIVRDPKLIIFDEATSALDATSEKIVQDAIDHLVENRTTLIVAHRLSTVRKADRIVVMEAGKIIESGSPAELLKKADGPFKRLHEVAFS